MSQAGPDRPEVARVPLSRLRRRIGSNMLKSLATSPHVTLSVDVDYHAIACLREQFKEPWASSNGFALTYLPFVARRICSSLLAFGDLNASIQDGDLLRYSAVNLGVAVDLDGQGLVVPVIRRAESLTVAELAVAAHALAAAAAEQRLTPDDVRGGTFTVSSPGRSGADRSTPIIHQPQVAILAIDAIRERPIVDANGSIVARPVGALSLSFDHRVVDGVYASGFLHQLRAALEQETSASTGLSRAMSFDV